MSEKRERGRGEFLHLASPPFSALLHYRLKYGNCTTFEGRRRNRRSEVGRLSKRAILGKVRGNFSEIWHTRKTMQMEQGPGSKRDPSYVFVTKGAPALNAIIYLHTLSH